METQKHDMPFCSATSLLAITSVCIALLSLSSTSCRSAKSQADSTKMVEMDSAPPSPSDAAATSVFPRLEFKKARIRNLQLESELRIYWSASRPRKILLACAAVDGDAILFVKLAIDLNGRRISKQLSIGNVIAGHMILGEYDVDTDITNLAISDTIVITELEGRLK